MSSPTSIGNNNPLNDVLQLKPKGSCKIDKEAKGGQTYINICTYNTRTIRTDESLESLLDELKDFKWDIIGLAETKREGESTIELPGGIWLYNHGKTEDNKKAKGIGFLIHQKFKNYIEEIKSYSNRVIALKVRLTGGQFLCIVQIYAPTGDYDDEAVEEVYEDVNKAFSESKAKYRIVMGDFNAKIGKRQAGEESLVGKHGIGVRNKRGEMLLEFASQQKLVVANTFFKKKESRYWTWESPNGKTRNQIDFILSSQRGILRNCEVITKVDIGSDHRMVRAKIVLNKKLARLNFINNKRKSKLDAVKLAERKQAFQIELKNRFAALSIEDSDVDTKYSLISDTVKEVAEKIAPKEKQAKQKSEEDKEIDELDTKRKKLKITANKTTQQNKDYQDTVKLVRKKRRQRSRRKEREQIESILESGRGPKQIQKLNSKKTRIRQMKKKDGTSTTNRGEVLNVCAEFYQELYSSRSNQVKENFLSPDQMDIPTITVEEIELAVKQMKKNKAPGLDEITSDIIKIGGEQIYTQLASLYNQILTERKIPKEWKEAKVILLHKKGDKEDIKNYRPISLLSHPYKIFTRILQTRMKRVLDENQPREQAGFRQGFSTTDHLQALSQLIEKANEYQIKLCVGFIDYEKAFDSVEHSDLFLALRKIGINEGYVQILEDIYTDATARIHIDEDISKPFKISRGVRQGDTISPKIFTAAMEEVFKKVDMKERGILIDGERLTDLRFADDVALLANSVKELEAQLNCLNKESRNVGLKMHKGKTKFMTNFQTKESIEIDKEPIEKVESYKYLGKEIKMENNTREEVLIKIKAGWSCFGRNKTILCDKTIPITLRTRVFNQCVLPTMTYGAETWSTTKETEQKLLVAQRAMERRMLNITIRDKQKNTTIRNKTKVKDIIEKIKEMKWRWAGHIARQKDNRWTIKTTEWQPRTGKRRRGRQKQRWRDELTEYRGTTWTREAQDRHRWKMLKEGFSLQRLKKPR